MISVSFIDVLFPSIFFNAESSQRSHIAFNCHESDYFKPKSDYDTCLLKLSQPNPPFSSERIPNTQA